MAASLSFHGVHRLDGIVPKHPSPGQRDRWAEQTPAVGAHRYPFGMNGGRVWLEPHHLLSAAERSHATPRRQAWRNFLSSRGILGQPYGDASLPRGKGCSMPTYDEPWVLILNVGTASTGAPTKFLHSHHAGFAASPVCSAGELHKAGNARPAFFCACLTPRSAQIALRTIETVRALQQIRFDADI